MNECDNNPCDENAMCENTDGSFTCTCINDYTGDGFTCTGNDGYNNYGIHIIFPQKKTILNKLNSVENIGTHYYPFPAKFII